MKKSDAFEVNFDGVIGPTHNYSGLSYGNLASVNSREFHSNPKQAALQGLEKMWYLATHGVKQALLPPQERPHILTFKQIGFQGTDAEILEKVAKTSPDIFRACSSSSSMWAANAATVAPSTDTADGKVHFTPANLVSKFHRAIEHPTTSRILRSIFSNDHYFVHHSALLSHSSLGDEGAANHTRFCTDYGEEGIHLFVYGRSAFRSVSHEPKKFPARQTLESSQAIVRLHQLQQQNVVFAQQNPEAIDAGVFHNDVVSVGNKNVFFYHESAFVSQENVLSELNEKFKRVSEKAGKNVSELIFIPVDSAQVSLEDVIRSYLFNTQLIQPPDQSGMLLIAPKECEEVSSVQKYLEQLLSDPSSPIQSVEYFDLRQSMQNGGGPACLRLRVVLNAEEIAKSNLGVFLNERLYIQMTHWIGKHYRDRMSWEDLSDPRLLNEVQTALDELTQILQLGSIYSFQCIYP